MKKVSQFIMNVKAQLVQWHQSFRTKKLKHYGHTTYSTVRRRNALLPSAYCQTKEKNAV
jgi:hypothetical protein